MTLKYRQMSYEPTFAASNWIEGEIGGKYRGQQWHQHYPRHLHQPAIHSPLKYRSISYTVCESRAAVTVAQPIKTTQIQPKIIHPETPTENWKTVHQANVCRLLEHRLQQAEAEGNQQLLDLLKAEAQQWAC